ncbi:hypothetical protein [Methanoplanus endosymbiosus]|uniref:Uncharacterized protein n=1 Tax=Methanoplanus endosymbiosus TaxID=33865 RepID=A0A9E7TM80_9EURY|nr:hypothetical protein [Methanoplanus endosymbiosus]UUX93046.1 hypothetical protein L6E24_02695 [Methanoplanus endosymbiosus]
MCTRVKSSLDIIRKNGVNCRTKYREKRVKDEIVEKFGEITIPEKQYRKIMRQDANHKKKMEKMQKSLMKAFQQKEKARLIQKLRNEKIPKTESSADKLKSEKKGTNSLKESDETGVFDEIEIGY